MGEIEGRKESEWKGHKSDWEGGKGDSDGDDDGWRRG